MDRRDAFHGSLFEAGAPVGMYRFSSEGRILKTNPALVEMLGYDTSDELVGEEFEQKVVSSLSARSNFKQLLHWNGRVEDFISPWRKRNGRLLLVRETGWINPGQKGGILYYEARRSRSSEARMRYTIHLSEGFAIIQPKRRQE